MNFRPYMIHIRYNPLNLFPTQCVPIRPGTTITRSDYNVIEYEPMLNQPTSTHYFLNPTNPILSQINQFQPELMKPTQTWSICPNTPLITTVLPTPYYKVTAARLVTVTNVVVKGCCIFKAPQTSFNTVEGRQSEYPSPHHFPSLVPRPIRSSFPQG